MQNLLTCKLLKSLISDVLFRINLLSNSWLKMRIAHEIFCKKENENIKGIGASKNNWQKFSGVLRKNDLWALCKTLKDNGWEVDLTLETLIKTNKRLQWRYSETIFKKIFWFLLTFFKKPVLRSTSPTLKLNQLTWSKASPLELLHYIRHGWVNICMFSTETPSTFFFSRTPYSVFQATCLHNYLKYFSKSKI